MTQATTFTELWEEIKTEALNIWQGVKNEALVLEHTLVPTVEADIVLVLSQFKSVALDTVMALAQQEFANLTGTQKQDITVQSILGAAKNAGKVIVQQDAVLLAQQAYQGLASTVSTVKGK